MRPIRLRHTLKNPKNYNMVATRLDPESIRYLEIIVSDSGLTPSAVARQELQKAIRERALALLQGQLENAGKGVSTRE